MNKMWVYHMAGRGGGVRKSAEGISFQTKSGHPD